VKARFAVLRGIPPEFILVWQNRREVCDPRIFGPFEVKIRVPVRDISLIVDAGAKAEQVYFELETRHGVAPPFRLLSAGREADPKESLSGLAFPLDLKTAVVITFRRLNSRSLIRLMFIGNPPADVAIRKLSEELGIAPEGILLEVDNRVIQRAETLGDQVITFQLIAPNTTCLHLHTWSFIIGIDCVPSDTFLDLRMRVADSYDLDGGRLIFSCDGRPIQDHERPVDYASRNAKSDTEFPISFYTFLISKREFTIQMLPVTRIGEIRGSGCPLYPEIRRNILQFRPFGRNLPDEIAFREIDPREPITVDVPTRSFRVSTWDGSLKVSFPCGYFIIDLRRSLTRKWS
jgi:hypothetical protein